MAKTQRSGGEGGGDSHPPESNFAPRVGARPSGSFPFLRFRSHGQQCGRFCRPEEPQAPAPRPDSSLPQVKAGAPRGSCPPTVSSLPAAPPPGKRRARPSSRPVRSGRECAEGRPEDVWEVGGTVHTAAPRPQLGRSLDTLLWDESELLPCLLCSQVRVEIPSF